MYGAKPRGQDVVCVVSVAIVFTYLSTFVTIQHQSISPRPR